MHAPEPLQLIRICDDKGALLVPEWLQRAEHVHRQLRPLLPYDYAARMGQVFAGGGRMVVIAGSEHVLGLAVWRVFDNTFDGTKFYVDDLVTDEARRSQGLGRTLMAFLEAEARAQGAGGIVLDSGTQRTGAHRFYFREGFVITSFNFKKQLV